MSEKYIEITPGGEPTEAREPFRFILAEQKFELPALDSADIPLALIPIFLAMSSGEIETDEDKMRVAGTFIAYLERDEPKLWRTLRRQPDAIRWVIGLIEQWGVHSRLDPSRPASGD